MKKTVLALTLALLLLAGCSEGGPATSAAPQSESGAQPTGLDASVPQAGEPEDYAMGTKTGPEGAPEFGAMPSWPALYGESYTPDEILDILWWRAGYMYAGGAGVTFSHSPENASPADVYNHLFLDYEAVTSMVFTPNALAQYEGYVHGEPLIYKDGEGNVYAADYPMTVINLASEEYEASLLEETEDTRVYAIQVRYAPGGETKDFTLGLLLTDTGWLIDGFSR